jgi:hypothetical protein
MRKPLTKEETRAYRALARAAARLRNAQEEAERQQRRTKARKGGGRD